MPLAVRNHTMVIYILYKFHESPSNAYCTQLWQKTAEIIETKAIKGH